MNYNTTPTSSRTNKRLSLDVFKEKAIGNSLELTGGNDAIDGGSTAACSLITVYSLTLAPTLSGDNGCTNDDCH